MNMFLPLTRLILKIKYGKPIIVVSGIPRSGTSMVMQMLYAGGISIATDHVRKADKDNPKGYYELESVKNLEKYMDKSWLNEYKGKAVKIVSLLLPALPLTYNYNVIFILRDLDEVLRSQKKMLTNRGLKSDNLNDGHLKEKYNDHLKFVENYLNHRPQFNVLYISQSDIVNDVTTEVKRIDVFLGGGLNRAAMQTAVDESLYRNRGIRQQI
jgi:hypothetical protein